jgi:hypothetical protein
VLLLLKKTFWVCAWLAKASFAARLFLPLGQNLLLLCLFLDLL